MAGVLASTQTITSVNSTYVLSVPIMGLSFALQQYSAGRAFDIEDLQIAEARMGVDGYLAAGYTPKPVMQTISLEANSKSRAIMTSIHEFIKQQREIVYCEGVITLPSIGQVYTLNRGIFYRLTPMVGSETVLKPFNFNILWENVTPSSI